MEIGASTVSTPSRMKLFMALSRTPHGVLDMATPALAALFLVGENPVVLRGGYRHDYGFCRLYGGICPK